MINRQALTAIMFILLAPGAMAEAGTVSSATVLPIEAIGLSPGSLGDIPTPQPVVTNDTEPGERPLLPRTFPGSPALLPHGNADFLPIERSDNACIFCHETAEKIPGEATPIPQSHYRDLRNAPVEVQDEVVGARWNCIACHTPLTDAPPLVGNRFSK